MTWIAARRLYPSHREGEPLKRRRGRPRTKARTVGVWAVCPMTGQLLRVWHHRRTLVSVCGPIAFVCCVLIELSDDKLRPDWESLALRKRIKREGFREVALCGSNAIAAIQRSRAKASSKEVHFQNPTELNG